MALAMTLGLASYPYHLSRKKRRAGELAETSTELVPLAGWLVTPETGCQSSACRVVVDSSMLPETVDHDKRKLPGLSRVISIFG